MTTLTLGACSAGSPSPTGGESKVTGVAGGQDSAPSVSGGTPAAPSATALTPEAYKDELGGERKPMRAALDALAGARGLKSLDQKLGRARSALSDGADQLAGLTPPDSVRTQHDAYVAGLRAAAAALVATGDKVGGRDLCTSSAVLTDLDDTLDRLDEAGEALESAGDYKADVVGVTAGKKQTRRLRNGSYVRRSTLGGRSSLEIDNGGDRDAVVTAVRGGSKAFSVYVRKNARFKVRGVRDGTYRIYFTHGVDWDGRRKAFTRECSFERFQKSVKFRTSYTATQVRWHDWRVTLHAISGGNARTSPVDPDDFPG
ncbi:hypothetical protein FE391_39050 [Nonomuraea sp. KC401]|uniref:hypothetical protein n=1 Tax=unclassified Nonomuraea TaxID=2593643 RepID=UPI0010FE3ACB|nr:MULTISPECIES: hypothetical protein [unclassified Nonomuraea]NBE99985.1 hypothetical protein [Nonomuraea sp. K271]TLF56622.1 hypothetical protein FE391_39050 [Nonomuraea sp. KC401]